MRETKTHITCYTTHYTFCKLNKDTFTRSKHTGRRNASPIRAKELQNKNEKKEKKVPSNSEPTGDDIHSPRSGQY